MTGDLLLSDGSVARLAGLVIVAADAAAIAGVLRDAGGEAGSAVLRSPASRPDRWGRHAVTVSMRGLDPPDLADALLQAGLARVQAKDAPRDCLNRFLQSEALARRARVGLWGRAETALLDAADGAAVARRAGAFAVMEGRVTHVGQTRRAAFLNFGPRAIGASVEVPLVVWRELERRGWTRERLRGQKVVARGVVFQASPARLQVDDVSAIEIGG